MDLLRMRLNGARKNFCVAGILREDVARSAGNIIAPRFSSCNAPRARLRKYFIESRDLKKIIICHTITSQERI
jgi:hypothetical protein